MAVSKRLRYEVLRRDNYTCRYCGAKPPDVQMTVDHVVPKALCGSDTDPANLVAACRPCNDGKTSSSPDAPLVADVSEDAVRWSKAMTAAAGEMLARASEGIDAREHFANVWARYGHGPKRKPLPKDPGWEQTVDNFLAAGLPMAVLEECVEIAMGQRRVPNDNVFRYMCGVAWRKVAELRDRAHEIASAESSAEDEDQPDLTAGRRDLACELLGFMDNADREYAINQVLSDLGDDIEVEVTAIAGEFGGALHDRNQLVSALRILLDSHPEGPSCLERARRYLDDSLGMYPERELIRVASVMLTTGAKPPAEVD